MMHTLSKGAEVKVHYDCDLSLIDNYSPGKFGWVNSKEVRTMPWPQAPGVYGPTDCGRFSVKVNVEPPYIWRGEAYVHSTIYPHAWPWHYTPGFVIYPVFLDEDNNVYVSIWNPDRKVKIGKQWEGQYGWGGRFTYQHTPTTDVPIGRKVKWAIRHDPCGQLTVSADGITTVTAWDPVPSYCGRPVTVGVRLDGYDVSLYDTTLLKL